jgi:hypothetical protein
MKKNYLLLIASFVLFQFLNAQPPTSQTFNSSGTYTINVGYTASITIEAWGAGGGGGTNGGQAKGGGGGGAYSSLTTNLTAGTYTITVGTGGTPGVAGGASSFDALVIAAGGGSTVDATGGIGGTVAASTGLIRFAGGTGGAGATTTGTRGGGGGGGSATSSANGGNGGAGVAGAPGTGGAGGTGAGPGGAGGDDDGAPAAVAGTAPGGAGGGHGNTGNSANGAAGRVVVTVNAILPVRLKSFSATKKSSGVQLQWNAETESNLANYIIERSADGINFTPITTVTARNSANPVSYDYNDGSVVGNVAYYRIAMTEMDGKATFSRVIKVFITGGGQQLLVYPNPVVGTTLSYTTPDMARGVYTLKVFNSNAQVVYQMKYTHSGGTLSQQLQLPSGLKPGLYNLQLNDGSVQFKQSFLLQ